MKLKRKNVLRIGLGAIVFVAIVFLIITIVSTANVQKEKPELFVLSKTDIMESISATGRVESVTRENVSASADGKVKTVNVKLGDRVKKGDVLAVLDTTAAQRELEKSYNSKKSEIIAAQMELDLKSRDYNNSKILFDQGAISHNDLLKAENDYRKAAADYESKQNSSEIMGLKQKIADATIVAPIDGTVTMVNAARGTASSGVLFTIEDMEHLKITASVSEYDINSVKTGQKAVMRSRRADWSGTGLDNQYSCGNYSKNAGGDFSSSHSDQCCFLYVNWCFLWILSCEQSCEHGPDRCIEI